MGTVIDFGTRRPRPSMAMRQAMIERGKTEFVQGLDDDTLKAMFQTSSEAVDPSESMQRIHHDIMAEASRRGLDLRSSSGAGVRDALR